MRLWLAIAVIAVATATGRAAETPAVPAASGGIVKDGDTPSATGATPPEVSSPTSYRQIAARFATQAGLPAEIADAVMGVESGYNPNVIGGSGEIGLMQVLPSTARMMGFAGSLKDLAVPATNIHYGVTYLAQAWRLAGGDLCTTVMKYRAGHGETRFSGRSVDYCLAVRARLADRGYAVTGSVPAVTLGTADPAIRPRKGCRFGCFLLGGSRPGAPPNLASFNKRMSVIVLQTNAHAIHGL